MIRELFERKASYEATTLAEAQALIDDGLDLEFVLGLFPDDSGWLAPLLETSADLEAAFEGEPASYYFEASLKSKFLGLAREPKPAIPVVVAPPAYSPVRTAVATASVAMSAAAVGILALGFVTAGDANPGDWNYTFKLANERFQYSTSRGDSRIDVQLRVAQERLEELRQMSARGEINESQFARAMAEFDELTQQLAKQAAIDDVRKAQIEGLRRTTVAITNDVASKQPDLAPQAAALNDAAANTVAVAFGGATGLPSPSPTATPAEETPTPSPSETPASSPTASSTPTPEETPTPEPTPAETSTRQPVESGTETPGTSATP